MGIRSTALVVTTGAAAIFGAGLIFLEAPGAGATSSPEATQGLVAVIDRDSGTLRAPTADEAARYVGTRRAAQPDAPVIRRADGSRSMQLDDRYTIYSTVTRNADGGWAKQCGQYHDHATHSAQAVTR